VIPRERAIPQCDVYASLLSLPGIFGTTLKTLPFEVPYLNAPDMAPDTVKALPGDDRLKLGITWAGQLLPRDRSCPLGQLLPRLGDPRFAPISLQVGDRSKDLKATGADVFVTDMSPYLNDFAETAAVLRQLDLLVTIDTSVAHLAGALGVPTFLLLRRTSDWRWFDRIESSPWYPSFTLFRQTDARRWDEPLEQLEQALKKFANRVKRPETATSIFTSQEREVLKWYSAGKSQPEIAHIMSITARMVKFHLEQSFKKLDVNNGRAAVHKAASLGVISRYGSDEG